MSVPRRRSQSSHTARRRCPIAPPRRAAGLVALAGLIAAGAAGCGAAGDAASSLTGAADATGVYAMASFGGHSLPDTVLDSRVLGHGAYQILMGGQLILSADHSFHSTLKTRNVDPSTLLDSTSVDTTDVKDATWKVSGNTLLVHYQGVDVEWGTVSGSTITAKLGFTAVYTRQ